MDTASLAKAQTQPGVSGHGDLFDDKRNYVLGDPELGILGDRMKLAQWRHKKTGPPFYKLGRKIVYCGADLNAWAAARRFDPQFEGSLQ